MNSIENIYSPFRTGQYDGILSLDLTLTTACDVVILRSEETAPTMVTLAGSDEFLQGSTFKKEGETLCIKVESAEKEKPKDNRITVQCGFSQGKLLRITIDGHCDVHAVPDFEECEIKVTGDGGIYAGNFRKATVEVNKAGDVELRDVGCLVATVNDEGDVSAETVGSLRFSVSGSGDIDITRVTEQYKGEVASRSDLKIGEARNGDVAVSGWGDLKVNKCSGNMKLDMSGYCDVHLAGEVDALALEISGWGNLKASGLTADNATLLLSGWARAVIGRVKSVATEKAGQWCKLRVRRRG